MSAGYSAAYVGQCCYSTLEEGDTAANWFDFRNTGTDTWHRGVSRRLALPAFARRYRAGTRLEVAIGNPAYRTQIKTVAVRRGKAPLITTRCLEPGSPRRTTC